MSDEAPTGGATATAAGTSGSPGGSGGGAVSAQQQRLQQMIALQHAHSDSMRQAKRDSPPRGKSGASSADGGGGRTFAASEQGVTTERQSSSVGAASVGAPAIDTGSSHRSPPPSMASPVDGSNGNVIVSNQPMDPNLLTSLSMATPTLSNVSLAAQASKNGGAGGNGTAGSNGGGGGGLPRNNSRGGGRTAEYAKLLPGNNSATNNENRNNRNSNNGNIHYQDYSQHRRQQQQQPTSGYAYAYDLPPRSAGPPPQRELNHDHESQQFHDAASHASSYQTYGSVATAASGASANAGGYPSHHHHHHPGQYTHHAASGAGGAMGPAANFNISSGQREELSQHRFRYGDPSHAFDHDGYGDPYGQHHDQCMCCKCCQSCGPSNPHQAENLHRSLCFGAIDGLLTGSGITAACAGLGLLTTASASAALWTVVALCLAACASDGVCMCLGHIWSTYVITHASIAERTEERKNFNRDRAASKARLVDMLLDRGMLKIDAMSIADTLEGYPDIFVSALVGDAGALGPGSGGSVAGSAENLRSHGSAGALGVAHPELGSPHSGVGGLGGRSSLHYGSYGQFDEYRDDPDKAALNDAVQEGWHEGIVMMLSFSAFSVVPSLCFLLSSSWFPENLDPSYPGTSQVTVAISMLSTVMLLLGIWKSRFFDSHWILFGLEAVFVLLASLATAYCIGAALQSNFDLMLSS
mmetsp:Transcript_11397/g.32260  ORF Transcript_11397/g.32260 Transcript_11397/m.32260 type:complete len:697 (-) Transcript_11397:858-2948(-)